MGNKYMKPNQSIKDLCQKQGEGKCKIYTKQSAKSIEVIPNKISANRSQRFKFLMRSIKRKKTGTDSRPTTTDRVLMKGQKYVFSRNSIFLSHSDCDIQRNAKNLGFAIITDYNKKQDSTEIACHKYCYVISTSTPKFKRFNALLEFEKLFGRNFNDYGSDISSISKMSIESIDQSPQKDVLNGHLKDSEIKEKATCSKDKDVDKDIQNTRPPGDVMKLLKNENNNERKEHKTFTNTNFNNLCRKISLDSKKVPSIRSFPRRRPPFLNILVIGDKDVGKTTLIYSLLELPEVYQPNEKIQNDSIHIYSSTIGRGDSEMEISILDTPGLDTFIDGNSCFEIIEEYLLNVLKDPIKAIHCCIYCVSSLNKKLRESDIFYMKRLESRVNLIPVILKADILPVDELQAMKFSVKKSLEDNVLIYEVPGTEETTDNYYKSTTEDIKRVLPFAVIASMQHFQVNGEIIRGRKCHCGTINVDNPSHCDTFWLKKMLFESHPSSLVSRISKTLQS